MKVLVVGGGGREHALVWKLAQSPRVSRIYCAPGNGGIQQLARCVPIAAEDLEGLLRFALTEKIDLTVVGPEVPLVLGIVDVFRANGLRIFGPTAKAAAIEGSKGLAKELMYKYNIPTARFAMFEEPEQAKLYIKDLGAPCVVKADGLAAGKGVVVAMSIAEACRAVESFMAEQSLGEAGLKVVIEEFLVGEEVSVLAFTDGQTIKPMVWAQDHKRIFDGDRGPNTGGMGAYAPPPKLYNPELEKAIMADILQPIIEGLAREGRFYQGVLYAGLMLTDKGPQVLEFNARFGDPETQPVLMLLETDLLEIMEAIIAQKLEKVKITWKDGAAVCVVMASGGYPGTYEKGKAINGLEDIDQPEVQVFHAGTAVENGRFLTAGGRVLGVTAMGKDVQAAIDSAYRAAAKISFEQMHYRKDIGYRALK